MATDNCGPLSGLRVVELWSSDATAVAGKMLGDLGADVIVVEPPGGSSLRNLPPFVDDIVNQNCSLRWWSCSTSKRSVVLDLCGSEESRDQFNRLIATADVVLEGETEESLALLGLISRVN